MNFLRFYPAVNNVLKTFETAHECTFENSVAELVGMKKTCRRGIIELNLKP